MCLICGDTENSKSPINYKCTNKCKFYAHGQCVRIHSCILKIDITDRNAFQCSSVKYQLKPCEVQNLLAVTAEKQEIKKTITRIKSRGQVNTNRYKNNMRRWVNDEIKCEFCLRTYGTNELRHNAAYCTGAAGDPIGSSNIAYPFAFLKRFRHITFKVP